MPQHWIKLTPEGKLPPDFAKSLTEQIAKLADKTVFISIAEIKQPDKEILEYIERRKNEN